MSGVLRSTTVLSTQANLQFQEELARSKSYMLPNAAIPPYSTSTLRTLFLLHRLSSTRIAVNVPATLVRTLVHIEFGTGILLLALATIPNEMDRSDSWFGLGVAHIADLEH